MPICGSKVTHYAWMSSTKKSCKYRSIIWAASSPLAMLCSHLPYYAAVPLMAVVSYYSTAMANSADASKDRSPAIFCCGRHNIGTATDHAGAIAIARACIAGKLHNSRQVLLRGAREAKSDADAKTLHHAAKLLAGHQRDLPGANDLDTMRGLEGDSARVYFGALPALIRAEQRATFTFDQRSRRPPRDAFNALISFLYTLLTHDCQSALEGVGLDPQLGFLHAVRPGRPGLALDLMEEFRAVIADRLALTLINRSQLTAKHFEPRPGGAVYLNDDGRRTVLTAYQQRKQEAITHPLLEQAVPVGLLPHVQARLLARVLRGDMESYLPFINR